MQTDQCSIIQPLQFLLGLEPISVRWSEVEPRRSCPGRRRLHRRRRRPARRRDRRCARAPGGRAVDGVYVPNSAAMPAAQPGLRPRWGRMD